MQASGADVNVVASGGSDERMRALSDDVHKIRQQGEVRTYTDGRGNTVTLYKNVKRIIKPS
jgi:ABC-type Fe3+-hydroxamate transport system substrate-binding protein